MDNVGVQTAKCVHHWIIDPASGQESMGVCKRCGAQRKFDNGLGIVNFHASIVRDRDLIQSILEKGGIR